MIREKIQILIPSIFLVIIICCVWNVDIAFGAALGGGFTTNGWTTWSPAQAYHAALYCLLIFTTLLFAECMWLLYENNRKID